uniref:Laeverin n=1 Tax=Leptobrachium leishanense TaxID=445787 RepID=A0A8C5PQR7_9ANUR
MNKHSKFQAPSPVAHFDTPSSQERDPRTSLLKHIQSSSSCRAWCHTMGPKTSSGFYLSRTSAALLALFLAALLLALIILGALYARSKAPGLEEGQPNIFNNFTVYSNPTHPFMVVTPPGRPGTWNNLRLPKNVVPLHYELELWPRMVPDSSGNNLLVGQVNITIVCEEKTDVVLLHSHLLNISRAEMRVQRKDPTHGMETLHNSIPRTIPSTEENINIKDLWNSEFHQYLVLELEKPLEVGSQYTLEIDYHGFLSMDLQGLFLTHYKDFGIDKVLIASEMEPTSARTVYPCFDEPALKATFQTRIVHNSSYVALSNMPALAVSEREDADGVKWSVTTFNTTLKMSTYITAFVICDFEYITTTERGREIRVWARKEIIQKGYANFAQSIISPILSFMEDLLNITYPLQKTDFVALPYIGVGAMENWGLITFQETSLIYNPNQKFSNAKALVCLIVSHEIGHQWFGNLVTMKWWNDLWLNEGFASYMEHVGASSVDCKLELNEVFIMHNLISLFETDTRVTLRALSMKEENIHSTSYILSLFDIVSYNKGAAFVRMVSSFLTEKLFLRGINIIDDQDEIQLPASLKQIMDSWTWQEGIPLLTLNTSTGKLSQEQLKTSISDNITSDNKIKSWIIPVSWMKNGVQQPMLWLTNRSNIFPEMKMTSNDDWIIMNVNVTGYYRVNYDKKNWDQLAKQLQIDHKVLPVVNRVQLIDSAFTLASYGYMDYESALDLTKYLVNEGEIIVWHTVLAYMISDKNPYINYKTFPLIKKYLLQRIYPIYQHYANITRINFDETADEYFIHTTIDNIFKTACSLGLQDCLDLAGELFSKMMKNESDEIPSSIQKSMSCYAIAAGDEKEWEFAWSLYNKSITDDHYDFDYEYLSHSLSCTKQPWLLYRFLHNILDTGSSHLALEGFQAMAKQDLGRYVVWAFLKENVHRVNDLDEGREVFLKALLPNFGYKATSESQLQEIQQFINKTIVDNDRDAVLNTLDRIWKSGLQWTSIVNTKIFAWFQKNTEDSNL